MLCLPIKIFVMFLLKTTTTTSEYLERLNGHSSFVLLLHNFDEFPNHLVSHIINVSPSLESRGQTSDLECLDHSDGKWPGKQPKLYFAE